jgi:transposase InsO family protein
MKAEERETKANAVFDFRYSIIAETLNPYLCREERLKLIRQKAEREYDIPYSIKKSITEACIRKWCRKFKEYGKEGLIPKTRSDMGTCRVLPPEESAALLEYLETHPELTAKSVYQLLKEKKVITKELSKSSLSRLVVSAGMERHTRMQQNNDTKQLKFAFKYPLECVQADMMHAFAVADGNGKLRKTYLLAMIDDATRRILYADFAFRESSLEFEYGIKHVLLSHGRIGKFFVDNGSPFVSGETKRILSILGIPLIHSRVGYSASRGKIERFFRTTRDQFLRPLDKESIKSLADLNARYHSWVESEYHRNPHRGLRGKAPLDVWLESAHHIIQLDPTVDLDEIFMHEVKRIVYKDSSFTLNGLLYEVPSILSQKKIKLRFNPFLPVRRLEIIYDNKSYGEARLVDTYANTRVKRNNRNKNSLIAEIKEIDHEKPALSPTRAAFSASQINLIPSQGENNDK